MNFLRLLSVCLFITLFAIACGGGESGDDGADQKGECKIYCGGGSVDVTSSITKGECIAAGKVVECEATFCPPVGQGECEKVYPEKE